MMTPLPSAKLERLKELLAKATERKWIVHVDQKNEQYKIVTSKLVIQTSDHGDERQWVASAFEESDAIFIAELANHAESLLAAAEKSERYRVALDRIANARPEEADEYFDKSRLFKCIDVAEEALRDDEAV